MKAKLTIRTVESVQPAEKDVILWDSELAGFACKVTPQGRRVYFLYYRTRENRQRKPTIGVHGAMKPEKAREIAKRWLAEVAAGGDPYATRKAGREAPTVKAVCERYLNQYAATRKRETSKAEDERLIEKEINPVLGALKITAVGRADVVRLHTSLSATPYLANRVLALLSKIFALAEQWALRNPNSNPARNIDRFPEKKREPPPVSAVIVTGRRPCSVSASATLFEPSAPPSLQSMSIAKQVLPWPIAPARL